MSKNDRARETPEFPISLHGVPIFGSLRNLFPLRRSKRPGEPHASPAPRRAPEAALVRNHVGKLERAKGFEPSTPTLAIGPSNFSGFTRFCARLLHNTAFQAFFLTLESPPVT
ncbi:hypothetical protein [Porphyrobacter sp. YT40]|uniref:hypothetical protein n=1 Tax=Porphyrobacter sp. YT40 TaxID=2547601 RepID=UPI001141607D|nr:hypothetical protein [Porphyrobacter sp. YT40]QDH33822.1 hypothetical protein E2E27_05425 [Porphyrobacter sp. YT40]